MKKHVSLPKSGKLLGIDFGERRIGVAITDELQITSQPLKTFIIDDLDDAVEKICEICKSAAVRGIVLGLPIQMNGSEGEMARRVRRFSEKLQQASGLPLALFDERLSSLQAQRILREFGLKTSQQKGKIDRIAATLILRTYLDYRSR